MWSFCKSRLAADVKTSDWSYGLRLWPSWNKTYLMTGTYFSCKCAWWTMFHFLFGKIISTEENMQGFQYKSQEIILDTINVFVLRFVCINSKMYDTILYKMTLWMISYRAGVGSAVFRSSVIFWHCWNACMWSLISLSVPKVCSDTSVLESSNTFD